MGSLVKYLGTRKFRWRVLPLVRSAFELCGRSWNDFYAWMLNFQDRQLSLDQILSRPDNPSIGRGLWDWARGKYYYEFLSQCGVSPSDTLLDYGCGYGRVAIPVLRGQGPDGNFIGLEISERRLELAREWIAREGLESKSHELILSKDNSMPFVASSSVDVVWVLSVFNHMPDAELDTCLEAMHRVLKPGGKLFCYYLTDEPGSEHTIKTFMRSDEYMAERLRRYGFSTRMRDDFDADLGSRRTPGSRMVLATRHVTE